MSRDAERIAEAHREYRDAIGTDREDAAYLDLRSVVSEVKQKRAESVSTCLVQSSTGMEMV